MQDVLPRRLPVGRAAKPPQNTGAPPCRSQPIFPFSHQKHSSLPPPPLLKQIFAHSSSLDPLFLIRLHNFLSFANKIGRLRDTENRKKIIGVPPRVEVYGFWKHLIPDLLYSTVLYVRYLPTQYAPLQPPPTEYEIPLWVGCLIASDS